MFKKTMKKWIVIANATDARIYQQNNDATTLQLTQHFHSEKAHLHAKDVVTDRAGRVFESAVIGRHALEPTTELHREAKIEFAHEIMAFINHAIANHEFETLILVASPKLLGELRKQIHKPPTQATILEIAKDLSHVKEDKLPEVLKHELELASC